MGDINQKYIVFDADGTLLKNENPYLHMAKKLEVEADMRALVEQYLNGKITYNKLIQKEIELIIKGYRKTYKSYPKIGDIERLLPEPATYPNAGATIRELIKKGYKVIVLSSGFYYMIKELARFDVSYADMYANEIYYSTSGKFLGFKVNVQGDKIAAFKKIVKKHKINMKNLYQVSDNAFEQELINHILQNGGTSFYLMRGEKMFEMKKMPKSENFIKIQSLKELKSKI